MSHDYKLFKFYESDVENECVYTELLLVKYPRWPLLANSESHNLNQSFTNWPWGKVANWLGHLLCNTESMEFSLFLRWILLGRLADLDRDRVLLGRDLEQFLYSQLLTTID